MINSQEYNQIFDAGKVASSENGLYKYKIRDTLIREDNV
jgi:hypothetical protein